jgi:hypothetical protein
VDLFPSAPDGAVSSYYPPRWRLLLLALGCAGVAAVVLVPALTAGPVLAGISWVLAAVLAASVLVLLARALRPGPTVLIDRDGITDRTTLAPVGLVRWEEITVIRKRDIGRGMGAERLLEIVLADPDGFRSRRRGLLPRAIDGYRMLVRQPVVSIPGSMVSVPMQVLMDEIRQRRPGLQVLEGPPPAPSKFHMLRRRRPQPGRRHPDLPRW